MNDIIRFFRSHIGRGVAGVFACAILLIFPYALNFMAAVFTFTWGVANLAAAFNGGDGERIHPVRRGAGGSEADIGRTVELPPAGQGDLHHPVRDLRIREEARP